MKIVHGWNIGEIESPTVATLGVFDGLHIGHQTIIRKVVERAEATRLTPTVVTFDPHPRLTLHPETAPPLLQTLQQRLEALRILGVRQTVVLKFDRELAALTAEAFTRQIVIEALQAKEIYLGRHFAFGNRRGGTIATLQEIGRDAGFIAEEVNEVLLRGRRVSSTLLRQIIQSGGVNVARRMLGRPYGVEGEVVAGRQLGRTISFPTANLQIINRVIPANGVYVTATLIDGAWRRSVTNVGVRPTVSGAPDRVVETHVLDFDGDLYGRTLRTRFLHRLRDEKKFSGVDDLRAQIARDAARAARFFTHSGVRRSLTVA
jgi:riboflavin kinase/FMN adenylyltransferase